VFTARYGLSPYIPQIGFVFKRLKTKRICYIRTQCVPRCKHHFGYKNQSVNDIKDKFTDLRATQNI